MAGSPDQSVRAPGARRVAVLVALLGLIGAISFLGDAASPVLLAPAPSGAGGAHAPVCLRGGRGA